MNLRWAELNICVCFGGADLTSTSYVYSSLVGDRAGRVVAGAAIDAPIGNLCVRHIQVAEHMAFRGNDAIHAVVAVFDDGVVVQCPGDGGEGGSFHVTHQWYGLIRAHHLLAEGREDLWRPV